MKRFQPKYFSAENPSRLYWEGVGARHLVPEELGQDETIPAVEVSRSTADASLVLTNRTRLLLFVGCLGGSVAGVLFGMWDR